MFTLRVRDIVALGGHVGVSSMVKGKRESSELTADHDHEIVIDFGRQEFPIPRELTESIRERTDGLTAEIIIERMIRDVAKHQILALLK